MKLNAVEQIVRATLYEGYMLYPYRPTSVKNQQRWNFGVLYPQSYSAAQTGTDACSMQTECLLVTEADASLEVRVRFLRLIQRQTGTPATPVVKAPGNAAIPCQTLDFLKTNGIQTWQEAIEQEISAPVADLKDLERHPQRLTFSFPASRTVELMHNANGNAADDDGKATGVIVRTQEHLEAELEISAYRLGDVIKVTVVVFNRTPFIHSATTTREQALLCSLVSTHTILGVHEAEFVSLLDPPDQLRAAAANCGNIGTWPVLVGEEGSKDTMLSSPIILYDYPQIAPESPGDLFDGTEIDEILTLRIMTLTEEEKREVRGADDRARKILERTEMLPAEQLMKMHGAVRGLKRMKAEGGRMKAV